MTVVSLTRYTGDTVEMVWSIIPGSCRCSHSQKIFFHNENCENVLKFAVPNLKIQTRSDAFTDREVHCLKCLRRLN